MLLKRVRRGSTKPFSSNTCYSPAMWSIFQLQDILGIDESLRNPNYQSERINIPAISNHYWRYRMHITLEHLLKQKYLTRRSANTWKRAADETAVLVISTTIRLPVHHFLRHQTHQPTLVVELEHMGIKGYGEAPAISYYDISVDKMIADLEQKRTFIEKYALTEPERFWHFLHHLIPRTASLFARSTSPPGIFMARCADSL